MGGSPGYTMTEDYALGMELKKEGYHCRYVREYLALGMLHLLHLKHPCSHCNHTDALPASESRACRTYKHHIYHACVKQGFCNLLSKKMSCPSAGEAPHEVKSI